MSLYDYNHSQQIACGFHPFYGIIMAAMRQADSTNLEKLKAMWPDTWEELQARYNAPGGLLPGEKS
ncbi:MAG TPA: hypothetical protein PL124_07180 [Candidatus Cloacimonadota bacterium]|nr:hypothetical protein [Candidatus Cloacimonadota bacterium]